MGLNISDADLDARNLRKTKAKTSQHIRALVFRYLENVVAKLATCSLSLFV